MYAAEILLTTTNPHHKDTGAIVVVIAWLFDLQLHVQSVSITTKVERSNLAQGEAYTIQHYEIKFVSVLRQIGGFSGYFGFLPIKLTATI